MEQNLNSFLAFDPGEKTGWASFNSEGALTGSGIIHGGLRGLSDYLCAENPLPHKVICETYRIKDFKFKHNMSTVPTIRLIGVLEEWAYRHGAQWIEQESSVYRDGIRWAGLKVPSGHVPDNLSAIGHGVYHLHKHEKLWVITL